MYCSHCGKKVNDTMLFCPFCGDPIVIPDQDEAADVAAPEPKPIAAAPEPKPVEAIPEPPEAPAAPEEPEPEPAEAPKKPEKPAREVGEAEAELLDWNQSRRRYAADDVWANPDAAQEAFSPLTFDEPEEKTEDWREEIARRKEEAAPQKKAPDMNGGEHEPVRLDGAAPKLEADIEGATPLAGDREKHRKGASTLVPPKQMDPNDIFMDGSDRDEFDDYDGKEFADETFAFEDADEGSFFMRHIRGIVGLALFAILILMFVIYAFSKAGQQSLARINLAWSTEAYTQLGYEYYQAENYTQAGLYYERALQREPNNYNFASSAAMAYVNAKNTDKAAAMLKRCAEINPTLLEPYIYLLNLYPDAAQRPWDITQLLQKGYEYTGDSRLDVTG